jgi:rhodanese-related sulfurtransferase
MSTMISVAELKAEIDAGRAPQMIDVRTPAEYATGHIPGTVSLPMNYYENRRHELAVQPGVVVVCKMGGRATTVASWLPSPVGARVLSGGTDAWVAAGLKLE